MKNITKKIFKKLDEKLEDILSFTIGGFLLGPVGATLGYIWLAMVLKDSYKSRGSFRENLRRNLKDLVYSAILSVSSTTGTYVEFIGFSNMINGNDLSNMIYGNDHNLISYISVLMATYQILSIAYAIKEIKNL